MSAELKETIQKLNEAWDQYKKTADDDRKHVEQHGEKLGDHAAKLEKIDAALDEFMEQKSKLEKDVAALALSNSKQEGDFTKEQIAHKDAFERYIRSFKEGSKTGDYELMTALMEAEKAVSTTTPGAGGHAVPEIISRDIDAKLLDISEMMNLVKVVTVGSSDYKELVNTKGMGYGWVGETDTRTETATPNLEQVVPTIGTIYAYPQATEESLQDIFFNVQSWLVDEGSEAFEKGIGDAIINGDALNKPSGILNGTPVAIPDDNASPERAFGTLEYIPTGYAATLPPPFNLSASPQIGPQGDFIYDLVYSLKKGYRRNARFLMNKNTLKEVRKFRDGDGEYIWRPGIEAGQPSSLAGYALNEMEDMPDIGANAFPIAFGDFRAGYTFTIRAGMSMTIDDNITTPGYVKFYMRRRVGGILRNDDAIKVVKVAIS